MLMIEPPPRCEHGQYLGPHAVEDTAEIHRDNVRPAVERIFPRRQLRAADAGVVDRNVEPPERIDGGLNHRFASLRIRHIHTHWMCCLPDVLGHPHRRVFVDVGDQDLGTTLGQEYGACLPDARTAAGDNGDLSRQILLSHNS
jgi:hypothetical protein